MKSSQRKQIGVGSLGGVGKHKTNKKVSMRNIEIGSQRQFGHPSTSKAHLHGGHLHPKHPTKGKG
jgi:hypothetical protein